MEAEQCKVFNDTTGSCPMLIINQNPIGIRVTMESLNYWARFIYQLSHELTHYVIRQYKTDKNFIIKWFEETLCEVMSLYILWKSGVKWFDCTLSELNLDYHSSLKKYLNKCYNKTSEKSVIKACRTLLELQKINNTSENERFNHSIERNYLYNTFRESPESMTVFVSYPHYALTDLQIDLDRWEKKQITLYFINYGKYILF